MPRYSHTAGLKRAEREAKRRLKEFERREKEAAKLSELEQARLEVEAYEARIDSFLSIHKEQPETWDWLSIASEIPPVHPRSLGVHRCKAELRSLFTLNGEMQVSADIDGARKLDDQDFAKAHESFENDLKQWVYLNSLAPRVLGGSPDAFLEVLTQVSPLGELAELGSAVHFSIHTKHLIECNLMVKGTGVIPEMCKTLTASGKLSSKPLNKTRFHEIYQDYICSCMLRVAREVFAALPVDGLLITASVEASSSVQSTTRSRPVLSAMITRAGLQAVNMETADPSDCIESCFHRGDFKASRKSEAFNTIAPLTVNDLPQQPTREGLTFAQVKAKSSEWLAMAKENAGELFG